MASVKHHVAEHDVVALRERIGRWPAATSGTVVGDYGDVKLVEIADVRGTTLDLVRARLAQLDVDWRAGG